MSDNWQTRQTLLQRAKNPDDHRAWEDFVGYYREFITIALFRMNVPETYHDDITQNILLKIWKALPAYEIDPNRAKFRTWLSRVIRNEIINSTSLELNRRKKHDNMAEMPTVSIDESEWEQIIELEWKEYLANRAMDTVKQSFSGQAVDAFTLTLDGTTAADVAKKLNLTERTVYTLKARVKSSLVKEIARLRQELEI